MSKASHMEALRKRADEVASLLKILSHPNRLLIACELIDGERSVSELEVLTGVRQPVLSRELARLRDNQLVSPRRVSKEVFYSLADDRLHRVITTLCVAYGEGVKQKSKAKPTKRKATSTRASAGE